MLIRIGILVACVPALVLSQPFRAPPAPAAGTSAAMGKVVTGVFHHAAGARRYRVFLPDTGSAPGRALIVMLHGCAQTADEIARLTRMDEAAAARGLAVLYPEQTARDNPARCWNWFDPAHQHRDAGEPAILAGMIRQVVGEFRLDSSRVHVVGMSAGAAMASVLAVACPELVAGLGLHSAVPYRSAESVTRALGAMRGEGLDPAALAALAVADMGARKRAIPVIVIHGDADPVVNEASGKATAEQWQRINEQASETYGGLAPETYTDQSAGPDATFTRFRGSGPVVFWSIRGMAHAWSGGQAAERWAHPRGPDATRLIVQFLVDHAKLGDTGKER